MTEQKHTRSQQYERIRDDFEHLDAADKARFLIEATVTTMARGLEQAGRSLADELDEIFQRCTEEYAREDTQEASNGTSGEAEASPDRPDTP